MYVGIGSGSISPLAFLLPVVIFSVGVPANQALSGVLSSFVSRRALWHYVSLTATLLTDFVENLQPETDRQRNRSTKRTVYQISVGQRQSLVSYWPLWFSWWLPSCLPNQEVRDQFYRVDFTICLCWALLLYGSGGRVDTEKLKSWNRKGRINALQGLFNWFGWHHLRRKITDSSRKLLFMNYSEIPYLFVYANPHTETVRDMLATHFQYWNPSVDHHTATLATIDCERPKLGQKVYVIGEAGLKRCYWRSWLYYRRRSTWLCCDWPRLTSGLWEIC